VRKRSLHEDGQGTLEYIFLIGGVIVGMALVFFMYQRMATTTANKLSNPADDVLFPGDEIPVSFENGTWECKKDKTVDAILNPDVAVVTVKVPDEAAQNLMSKGWSCIELTS
jgi:hypothetical protein